MRIVVTLPGTISRRPARSPDLPVLVISGSRSVPQPCRRPSFTPSASSYSRCGSALGFA